MTTLYQVALDQSVVDCGMSYVYQLESGHFFILDGGYFTPGEGERLYRFLCERCEGKPHISGWFFSHIHQDHIGAFMDVMLEHRDDIDLECLIFNFPETELPATCEDWREQSHDIATLKRFYEILDSHCKEVPVVTPHMGEHYQIEELSIDVLFSHEHRDEPSTVNDQSTVLKITTAGQSVLFLGDIWKVASRVMLAKCKEQLPCDIVQIAHHCFNGGTIELYQAINAETAMWPVADYAMEREKERPENVWLQNNSSVKQHIYAYNGTVGLQLPYHPVD